MDKKDIDKNVLDLKHQKTINSFNIIVITLITSYISIVIGTLNSWDRRTLIALSILMFLAILLLWLFFEEKLKNIRKEIENL